MDILSVRGLAKGFKEPVFEDITFDLKPHEALGIIGPNGSGKSTLLNTILGLIRPSSGEVDLAHNIKIGVSFQAPQVYYDLKVKENLEYFRSLCRGEKAWMAEVSASLKLDPWKNYYTSHLSIGNLKKLDLAVAFLGKPDLLILDEPTAGMDYASTVSLESLVDLLLEDGGSMIAASHDLSMLGLLTNRVSVLYRKQLAPLKWELEGDVYVVEVKGVTQVLPFDAMLKTVRHMSDAKVRKYTIEDAYREVLEE